MVKLIKMFKSDEKIIYKFHSTDECLYGTIEYNFKTKKITVLKHIDDDKSGYFSHKATKCISKAVEDKGLKDELMLAWY